MPTALEAVSTTEIASAENPLRTLILPFVSGWLLGNRSRARQPSGHFGHSAPCISSSAPRTWRRSRSAMSARARARANGPGQEKVRSRQIITNRISSMMFQVHSSENWVPRTRRIRHRLTALPRSLWRSNTARPPKTEEELLTRYHDQFAELDARNSWPRLCAAPDGLLASGFRTKRGHSGAISPSPKTELRPLR